jgi:hypothetical protein
MGYWNYGFGHHLMLGLAVRAATGGRLDLFKDPKNRVVMLYPYGYQLQPGKSPHFADGGGNPSIILLALQRQVHPDITCRAAGEADLLNGDISAISLRAFGQDPGPAGAVGFDTLPPRTWFPDAQVLISRVVRPERTMSLSLAIKGGHNAELHNHNDVGSYTLLLGDAADPNAADVYVSRDPGGETYTARTFSSRRYEGELLNSFGHPVPRIAGKLQSPGGGCRGVVVSKSFEDAEDDVTFDITSAYPEVKTLEKATRTFQYRRATGDDSGFVAITDAIKFKEGEKGAVETALITFEKVEIAEIADGALEIEIGGAVVNVFALDANGKALKLVAETAIVGEHDDSVRNKPTRVALRVDGDVENATITQLFEDGDL